MPLGDKAAIPYSQLRNPGPDGVNAGLWMSILSFLTPGQPGVCCPREAPTPGSKMWGTALQDLASVSQRMNTPFTLPVLAFPALAHVKCCEACDSSVGRDNTAFQVSSWWLKPLAELVAALAPPLLWWREASGNVELCLVLEFTSGFIALAKGPSTGCCPPRNGWVLRRSCIYSVLSPMEPFIFCSALLCCSGNTN